MKGDRIRMGCPLIWTDEELRIGEGYNAKNIYSFEYPII